MNTTAKRPHGRSKTHAISHPEGRQNACSGYTIMQTQPKRIPNAARTYPNCTPKPAQKKTLKYPMPVSRAVYALCLKYICSMYVAVLTGNVLLRLKCMH